MNWNEREAIRDRLMENLARHMISHGIIKSDRERSNPFWRRSSLFSFFRAVFSSLICRNWMDISVAAAELISRMASFSEHSSMRRRMERIISSLLMESILLFSSSSSRLMDTPQDPDIWSVQISLRSRPAGSPLPFLGHRSWWKAGCRRHRKAAVSRNRPGLRPPGPAGP